ncbi:pyocin knob domain-containing protein [Bacillus sp. JJ63]|uniref:pyocin knob domain-containing protein n=1 Tax=Bacillus sp. JJ63 TaxID=3122968 RepID=UPI002FFEE00D
MELAKQKIDEAIANNGWVIFGMHCHYPDFHSNVVKQIVEYARLNGVEIVSVTEGLNSMGNIVEIGDSYSLVKNNTYIVDCDGVSHGVDSPHMVYRSGITNNSIPSDFPIGKPTMTMIGTTNTAGFPKGTGGVVLAHVYGADVSFPWIYQEWYSIATDFKYIRYWDRTTTAWTSWKIVQANYLLGTNEMTPSTPLTDLDIGTNITSFNNSNAVGLPSSIGGVLQTFNAGVNGWGYQLFKQYNTSKLFLRQSNTDGSWEAWIEIATDNPCKIGSTNQYTNNSLIADFPANSITTILINTSGATGFPNNTAGTLTTYRLNDARGKISVV